MTRFTGQIGLKEFEGKTFEEFVRHFNEEVVPKFTYNQRLLRRSSQPSVGVQNVTNIIGGTGGGTTTTVISTAAKAYAATVTAGANNILFPNGVVASNSGWLMIQAYMMVDGAQVNYTDQTTNKTTTGFSLEVADNGTLMYFFTEVPFTAVVTVAGNPNTITLPITMANANWILVACYMMVGGVKIDYVDQTFNKTTTSFQLNVTDDGTIIYYVADQG